MNEYVGFLFYQCTRAVHKIDCLPFFPASSTELERFIIGDTLFGGFRYLISQG